MGFVESLRTRGKEKAEIDPLALEGLLDAMKHRLERIKKIEANAGALLSLIDPEEYEDPDFSKVNIIHQGERDRIQEQKSRFQSSSVVQRCIGARVSIGSGKGLESRPPRVWDGARGEEFRLVEAEIITGTISLVSLNQDGLIDLLDVSANTDRELMRERPSSWELSVFNLFTATEDGAITQAAHIELAS